MTDQYDTVPVTRKRIEALEAKADAAVALLAALTQMWIAYGFNSERRRRKRSHRSRQEGRHQVLTGPRGCGLAGR